jgi:endoglucanase
MEPAAQAFLEQILETPSPSGYETPLQEIVRVYAGDFADEVSTDVHGNVMAVRNPGSPLRVMLAGHCDQIGLVVGYVDDEGFLYIQQVGGWEPLMLVGQRMTVWTVDGPLPGVIGRKPIHLLTDEERKQVPKLKDLWLDIGAMDKEEAEKVVRIGDPVTVELAYREMRNGMAMSPAMDDKTGLWVVMEAMRRADREKLTCSLYAVSTVQEEVGLRGAQTSAFGIAPHVGVAVDVTHATDCPNVEKKQEGDIRLGLGPVIYRGPNMNPKVVDRLVATAEEHQIAYQMAASGRPPGTDANAIQVNRNGVATGLVSIPNRYMHSPVEVVSLEDMDRAADLLARFSDSLLPEADFTP